MARGYGVWFDGVVRDDPMYKQFWKGTGTRPLYVRIEEDRIVLLKEIDRELPASQTSAGQRERRRPRAPARRVRDVDVDAAIEEAVAEAMAAAEAAAGDAGEGEKVYSPEEAAALFGAGEAAGDDPDAAGGTASAVDGEQQVDADAEEAPAKPKRRTATRKKAPKVDPDEDA